MLIPAVTAAAVLFILFLFLTMIKRRAGSEAPAEEESSENTIQAAAGRAGEDFYIEEPSGDGGKDAPLDAPRGNIAPYGEKGSRWTLISLAVDYDRTIPFCLSGIDESLEEGYVRSGGVDNYSSRPAHGMSSASYIVWLYRNTFGNCDGGLSDPVSEYKRSRKVSSSELLPGDIGMYYCDESEGNHFGVCIGFYHGVPLFTHCSSVGTRDFPAGCNRISFLKSASDSYFSGSEPVDFRYFFRPDAEWTEGEAE